ncbi:DUF3426 domain-containing protein [Trinickia sp. YCB016]
MLLATRCPHCETVFRIQETQLALRGGLVRCGSCQSVFNASENLVDTDNGAKPVESGAPVETPRAQEPAAAAASPAAEAAAPQTAPAQNERSAQNAPAQSEPARPAPNFGSGAWDMWAPAADAQIDPALRHDVETLAHHPQVAVPGSLGPETKPAPAPEAAQPAPVHAEHDAAHPSAESGDMREPSFTAWPGPEMGAEPQERVSAATPAQADEPTFPNKVAPSWGADPEPHFGTPEPKASAAQSSTSEPSGANAFAAQPRTSSPFGAEPAAATTRNFEVTREKRTPEPSRIVLRTIGAIIAVVLAVALIAQLAWWRRETVMVYWPSSQALFAQVCEQLSCQISPPRDIDGLQVEASDLRQVDGPHHLELRVPLRNRYNVALAYPAMELTLLDDKNNVAIRRVLWPQDYVRPGTPIAAGLPARTTQTMIVRLDTGNAIASNFRVQIFYP